MTFALDRLMKRLIEAAVAFCLALSLILLPLGMPADAARTSMTGKYVDDTVVVARSLQETIALPQDAEGKSTSEDNAVKLIEDYISRYRNRAQVNSSLSYTTMQTALNAMAGHYKTFSNRPLPEKLKNRLNEELAKAQELVLSEN